MRTSFSSFAQTYGISPEQVVGTAGGTKYSYDKDGKPFLTKEPKLLLNDNATGKPEGIHLMISRRPYAAFGNSTGGRQMLEYTKAGDGARLAMLVLHDDAKREYAYGPAQGLPDTRVGTFAQALYDEARKDGWTVLDPFRTHGRPPAQEYRLRLNGHRLYCVISLFKVTYKSTIQVSRNFHALFTKTLENSDACD